ncbi:hypothetical protein K502DRAFT_7548 [Neoconidiobolus thromboides FSU 785]|nr:hypothetical protein K502DRAFT_7548 [Neoconidiobolus thromboides FSU 785]
MILIIKIHSFFSILFITMALDNINDNIVITIMFFWNLFIVGSSVLFVHLRSNLTIKFRNVGLTLYGVVATLLLTNIYFMTMLRPSTVPCHFVLWAISLCAPSWFLSLFGKFFLLAFSYQHAKSKLKANTALTFLDSNHASSINHDNNKKNSNLFNLFRKDKHESSRDAELGRNWYHQNRNRWTTQSVCVCIIIMLGFHAVVAALTQWLDPKYHVLATPQLNCIQGNGMIPLFITAILYFGVGGPLLVILLWPAKDAYWLKFELVALVLTTSPIITLFLLFTYVGFLGEKFYPVIFLLPFHLLTHCSSIVIPILDVYRNHLKKTPNNFAKFHLMLKDPDQFTDFKEFTVSDFTIENPLFYEAYINFLNEYDPNLLLNNPLHQIDSNLTKKSILPKLIPNKWNPLQSTAHLNESHSVNNNNILMEEISRDAESTVIIVDKNLALAPLNAKETRELLNIYEKFIAPGSDYQLNLNGTTVRQIKMRINNQEYDPLMYMPALNEVLDSMYRNTYVRFIKFQQF